MPLGIGVLWHSHGTQATASCPGQVPQRVSATGVKSWDVLLSFMEVWVLQWEEWQPQCMVTLEALQYSRFMPKIDMTFSLGRGQAGINTSETSPLHPFPALPFQFPPPVRSWLLHALAMNERMQRGLKWEGPYVKAGKYCMVQILDGLSVIEQGLAKLLTSAKISCFRCHVDETFHLYRY